MPAVTPASVGSLDPVRIELGAQGQWVLRFWADDDATQLERWSWDASWTIEDEEQIGRCATLASSADAIVLSIAGVEDGAVVGAVTLYTSSQMHWYVGYWISPMWRRRGIATAALGAATTWAFAIHPPLLRISLFTRPDNVASQRIAEGAGYHREGLLRRWHESGGTLKDVVMFSFVREGVLAPDR